MPRHQALPPEWELEIIELRGRFYPVRIQQGKDGTVQLKEYCAHLSWEVEYEHGIPFACGPQPTQGTVSMGTWKLAFDYCQRYRETFKVLYEAGKMAADTEVYPERNVWYREALQALGAGSLYVSGSTDEVHCSTFVGATYYSARAGTVEDVIALLYQKVYEQVHGSESGVQEEAASA